MDFASHRIKQVFYSFVPVFLGTTLVVFVLIKLSPGDPYQGWPPELKEQFGVHQPLLLQYFRWLFNVFFLDFGNSIITGKSVALTVISKYLHTLFIVFGALCISLLISIPLGYLSTFKKESKTISIVNKIFETISAIPVFILGFFIFLFFLKIYDLNFVLRDDFGFFLKCLFYLFLFFILGVGNGIIIELFEHLQAEFEEIKTKMYMNAVRARSVNYFKHLFRSSIIPILMIVSHRFIFLLSGVVILEYLFTIHGIGLLSISAARNRDYPLILGITVFTIVIIMIIKIIVELMIKKVYPRA